MKSEFGKLLMGIYIIFIYLDWSGRTSFGENLINALTFCAVGILLALNISQVYVILVFITNKQEMLIPCCCFFIILNDNCKEKPPMQMLDLKTKDCILLQLIISYHYNTHLFYIEYDAYFFMLHSVSA